MVREWGFATLGHDAAGDGEGRTKGRDVGKSSRDARWSTQTTSAETGAQRPPRAAKEISPSSNPFAKDTSKEKDLFMKEGLQHILPYTSFVSWRRLMGEPKSH
jgi:hypothetical protein